MSSLKKISQQTFWQIIGKGVTAFSTFIILGVVARAYGEAGTGVFTLALAYLAMFFLIADFGFNAHLLRKGIGYRVQGVVEWQKLLGTRILWSGLLVILAILLLPLWPFTTPEFALTVSLGSFAILGAAMFITSNLIFQAKLSYDRSVIASSVGTLVYLALLVGLSKQGASIPWLVFVAGLGWLVIGVVSLLLVKKYVAKLAPQFDLKFSLNLIKQSWPIAATLTLNVLYFRADAFILAYLKGESQAGVYNIAYSIFQTVIVLPTFIMNSYYPLMLESLKMSKKIFIRQIKLAMLTLFGIACVGSVVTYLLAPLIIRYLTGGGFAGATESLQILSLSFPAFFLSSLGMWLLVALDKYKIMLVIYGIGLIFNLAANLIYIPQYGVYGASWVTVISEYLILGMQLMILSFWRTK